MRYNVQISCISPLADKFIWEHRLLFSFCSLPFHASGVRTFLSHMLSFFPFMHAHQLVSYCTLINFVSYASSPAHLTVDGASRFVWFIIAGSCMFTQWSTSEIYNWFMKSKMPTVADYPVEFVAAAVIFTSSCPTCLAINFFKSVGSVSYTHLTLPTKRIV